MKACTQAYIHQCMQIQHIKLLPVNTKILEIECVCVCGYARACREEGDWVSPVKEEGVRWWRRIYNSWPNRICCCLAGLGMLEKESIYCCQSGGPLAWMGWFLGLGLGGVHAGPLNFFSPSVIFWDIPWHWGLWTPKSTPSPLFLVHYSHHFWIKLAVSLS